MESDTCINKVHLNGFKSFQRQTAVPFYKGMTAIVGSNGSGKSNLLDAMSFVLGRRSSKLRAEKLEQLIFNGGDNRKPSDKAEVYLHLDNSDGTFDKFLDEDEKGEVDEVKIGRKVTRNGYATYRFQDNNCKRSKIDRILEEAGIDPSSHHFVRQGKITSIVKQTPKERRKLIDRISGIESFDKKKEKALEELEEVEERLNEFKIKREMKKSRLERLEKQKEAAEEYQELEDKKRRLKYSILKMRKKALEKEMENLGEEEQEDRIEELEEEVEELDKRLNELEEEKKEIEEDIDDRRDSNVLKEIERLRGKIERKKGKIENKREKIEDLEELIDEYQKLSGYKGRNRAVKKVLDMDKEGVYGTVGQLIHYDKRFAAAIETALGGKIDNIVVESYKTANECVNYLKSNNIGRATFLPLDRVKPHNKTLSSKNAVKKPGVIDFATDLVDYNKDYDKAIKHVLGDTLVSEDLESLKDAGRVRAVTLDGDIKRKGGSITGGKKKRRRKNRSSKKGINPEKKKKEKEKLEEEIDELKGEIGNLSELLEDKKEEEKEQSQVSEELSEEKESIEEEIEEKREERKEKAEELEKLKSSIGKVRKKRAKFEAELENVEEDLEEFEGMDEDEIIEDDVSNLRRKRTRTVNKMNDLGNVNMAAIEEYQEFKEEYDSFLEKLEKAREEKQEVEHMIQEIEEKKEEKFTETLDVVSKEFSRIFEKLFDGGEAHLELEEKGNIDSGLLIKAQPPDKDPEVIDSLSGGEKTLTAIAFVFAIQEYDPSPFYVMDEIDAALDASNSRRLSELLKSYSEKSQLIFISHNEETVRHADRAYGVSMQDGVSKVRSIEI